MPPINLAVVGAGISGLTAAYALTDAGHRVRLFEREPTLGGHATTIEVGGRAASRSSMSSSTTWPVLRASVVLKRRVMTDRSLLRMLLRYPMITQAP